MNTKGETFLLTDRNHRLQLRSTRRCHGLPLRWLPGMCSGSCALSGGRGGLGPARPLTHAPSEPPSVLLGAARGRRQSHPAACASRLAPGSASHASSARALLQRAVWRHGAHGRAGLQHAGHRRPLRHDIARGVVLLGLLRAERFQRLAPHGGRRQRRPGFPDRTPRPRWTSRSHDDNLLGSRLAAAGHVTAADPLTAAVPRFAVSAAEHHAFRVARALLTRSLRACAERRPSSFR